LRSPPPAPPSPLAGLPRILPIILLLVFLSHLSNKPLFQHPRNRKSTGTKNALMLLKVPFDLDRHDKSLPPRRLSPATEFTNDGFALSMVTALSPAAILTCEGYGWYVYNIPYCVCMTVACEYVKGEAGEGFRDAK
jgi:hypothetical protein